MPLLIVAIILVAVILILRQERRGNGPVTPLVKPCRWRPVGFRNSETSTRWVCTKCNSEVFSTDGKPPKLCKRDSRPTSL
ncbi:MAG: hypothetical protein AAFY59_15130 [Pseudomonadota bacterium]